VNDYTRYLLSGFLHALPWLIGLWLISTIGIAIWRSLVDGADLLKSLLTGIIFLPAAVPLSPIIWLRWRPAARNPKGIPAVGLSLLWAVVTFPLAVGGAVLLANLLGVD